MISPLKIITLCMSTVGLVINAQTDITGEFCTVTQTPANICAQFKAFSEAGYFDENRTIVTLKDPSSDAEIGYTHFVKSTIDPLQKFASGATHYNRIAWLHVHDNYQNMNYGSRLLIYALAHCGNNCMYSRLVGTPLEKTHRNKYPALKRFYMKHGGIVEEGSENSYGGRFIFHHQPEQPICTFEERFTSLLM